MLVTSFSWLERTLTKGDLYLIFSTFMAYFQVELLIPLLYGFLHFLTPMLQAKYNFHCTRLIIMNETVKTSTVAVDSLGCKLNQAEIQQLARKLEASGYRLVDPAEKADIYILNTCTVTHIADRKSRHLLRLARRRNPAARLVAIGCYAHRAPAELAQIEGVELVLGNDRKMNLLDLLGDTVTPQPSDGPAVNWQQSGRTRAFLKVQSGCKNFCAYCIVPLVRSREENVPLEKVTALVRGLVAQGY